MLIIVLIYVVVGISHGDALPCSWIGGSTLSCSTEQHKSISLLSGQLYRGISVIRIHGSPSLLLINGDLFPQLQAIIGDVDCSRVVGVQVPVNGKWCSARPYHPSHPYTISNGDGYDDDDHHDEECRGCVMKSEVTALLIMAVLAAVGIPSGLALRWFLRRRRNARRTLHRHRREEEEHDEPPHLRREVTEL
ncbi:uncharacterized protein LOC124127212 [Haliotis rufescens]|uniref:uncharacterized protein LOC124127212 n=1 Tax=Haliotis rufescens TaxID=6454 RepID=UPI00201F427B|nr:uncharacterized protein LOC124127212 [Haliotis rufescens]